MKNVYKLVLLLNDHNLTYALHEDAPSAQFQNFIRSSQMKGLWRECRGARLLHPIVARSIKSWKTGLTRSLSEATTIRRYRCWLQWDKMEGLLEKSMLLEWAR